MPRRQLLLLALAGVLLGAAAHPVGASAVRVTASLVDIAFVPPRLTVAPGTMIRWHWSSANFEHHRVALVKAPRGVRRFRSRGAVKNFTFSRRLTRRGTYRFVCAYHPRTMRQTITVR